MPTDDRFVKRQNEELEAIMAVNALRKRGGVLIEREKELVATKGDRTTDCIRCGRCVHTLFHIPGPYICTTCQGELMARDNEAAPGSRWWLEIRAELIGRGEAQVKPTTGEVEP